MGLPLKKYLDLLVNYLKPQWRKTLLMVVKPTDSALLYRYCAERSSRGIAHTGCCAFHWHSSGEPGRVYLSHVYQRECCVDCNEQVAH